MLINERSFECSSNVLDQFLNLRHIVLQVLVPLELALHSDDILRVPDLAVVHCLEVLLELVQLGAEVLALGLDLAETLLALWNRVDVQLPLSFCEFTRGCTLLGWMQLGEVLRSQPVSSIFEIFSRS